jgi:enterochelin esterase-like enzyme
LNNTTASATVTGGFLLQKILPEVARHYNLSRDPSARAIGGISSARQLRAFTAAWHRPEAFRRVLGFVGSFTDLRGGESFPRSSAKRKRSRCAYSSGRNERPETSTRKFKV